MADVERKAPAGIGLPDNKKKTTEFDLKRLFFETEEGISHLSPQRDEGLPRLRRVVHPNPPAHGGRRAAVPL
ncbi:hypothetical protein SE15_03065 [Thermanaerothrix daxensis]|uniref:Uncharacterized protein n=1 Tax=Thermanaerothrix daxensis TaxID=869279 RepID=A0A0P6YGR0_9CHLR|nr:hypothetical protein SE15_03065 [Thermanaerothrix daxensis]